MKNEAKVMKNQLTSDGKMMARSTMNDPAVRLAMPVTALIWGLNIVPSASTAIWGTSAMGGAGWKQNFTAIWGTSGIGGPMQHASKPWLSMEIEG